MNLEIKLAELKTKFENRLSSAKSSDEVNKFKVEALGKKGELTQILKQLGSLSVEERKEIGKKANEIRDQLNEKIELKTPGDH